MPDGVLTFKRQVIPEEDIPRFRDSNKKFRKAIIKLDGTIEDCRGTLQVNSIDNYDNKQLLFFFKLHL